MICPSGWSEIFLSGGMDSGEQSAGVICPVRANQPRGRSKPPPRPSRLTSYQLGPYHGQKPDEMRLAIRRSQLCRQRLPPALKQFEMHNPSEHTTAWAVEAPIIIDARSINAATSAERRSMEIGRAHV